jgi:hypothetical protein
MTSRWRRAVAACEIVGGISGTAFLLWELANTSVNIATMFIAAVILLIYVFSLIAGLLLWRDHRWGRLSSIIVQAIQLPKIASPAVIFNICIGLDLYPYLMVSNYGFFGIGFELKLLAFYQLHIGVPFPGIALGVSIPACIFLTALIKNRKEKSPHDRFYVPPPTDPRYWDAPPAPDMTQDQFRQQPPPTGAPNQEDSS